MKAFKDMTNRRLIALYKSGHADTVITIELLSRSHLCEDAIRDFEHYNVYVDLAIKTLRK